jgi:hypothetical protein
VDRHGHIGAIRLTAQAVVLVLERHATRVGLDPEQAAGHSLRADLATPTASAGVPERVIAAQTDPGARWSFTGISARAHSFVRTSPARLD